MARAGQPAAYVGLDAFSVPMQGAGASQAEHRMQYTALLYTPDKRHSRYLVDFELEELAAQVRAQTHTLSLESKRVPLRSIATNHVRCEFGGKSRKNSHPCPTATGPPMLALSL